MSGAAPMAPNRGLVGGSFDGCEKAPDCRAWVQSGCKPALAGRDPAVLSAIVDVAGLADGRTQRVLRTRRDPAGINWGWVTIQFWRKDCTEIRNSRWASWAGFYPFRISRSAKWMTISSSQDNVNIVWTLTNQARRR